MLRRGLHGARRRRLLDGTMGRTNEEQGQVHYPRREERGALLAQLRLALPYLVNFSAVVAWGEYAGEPKKHGARARHLRGSMSPGE